MVCCARKWWLILGEAEGSKIRSTKKGLVGKEWIQNSDIIHVFSPIGIVEKLTKPTRKSNFEESPYLDHRAFEFLRFEHYKLFQQNIKNYWAMLRPEIKRYIFTDCLIILESKYLIWLGLRKEAKVKSYINAISSMQINPWNKLLRKNLM